MSKLELTDTVMDMVFKMSEGNPGVLTALMDVMNKGSEIDPDGMGGGIGTILLLDTYEIYGSEIYIIWNDIFNRNTRNFILFIRSCQLGYTSISKIKEQIKEQYGKPFPEDEWKEIEEKVCKRLPNFQK